MDGTLVFGDVFAHEDMVSVKEYVFLTEINNLTYAARILDGNETRRLCDLSETSAIKRPGKDMSKLYCFVVLTTPVYKDRAAHIGSSDVHPQFSWMDKVGTLEPDDVELLKKEIRTSDGAPIQLKKYVETAFGETEKA